MAVSFTPRTIAKRLVAAGNIKFYYEDIGVAAGTMTELVAADGDIDTTKPLQMFELYEKVFVVNGTNLKVADFGNTKLTCSALTDPPAHGDILTQATSGAKMVVDFVTTAKTTIYGKTIAGTFNITNDVSSNNTKATMNPASFVPSVVTAPTIPHWYDWTVYPDTKLSGVTLSYGTMPAQATLGCSWRGRACLSGDIDYPHQYYQARQENPWDWNYVSNDVQSPISGGGDPNVPGQVGDIVVAQIPFDRDHLIYGGANSLWCLFGDAAENGSLVEVESTGILGAKAWCKDNQDNLYVLTFAGLLKIPKGFGPAENLTEFTYPDFVKDLAYTSSTHRIILGYDKDRNGIKIAKTTLTTGANSCWWYDLKTEGLFPETYPNECGPYSMFYYESVNSDYKDLISGCKDGYMRISDDDAVNDDIGGSDEAIDSYVTFGPIKLGEENQEGKVNSLVGVTAGGGSNGSETDSDDVTFKIWTELSADKISERFSTNSGQKISGTIKAPGRWRGNQFRRSIRGMFTGIRIGNNTTSEVWGLEKLLLGIKKAGRMK